MAHKNIFERQAKVKLLLCEGKLTHSEIKKQLSEEFNCSKSAIHADIIYFRTKGLSETIFQNKNIRKFIRERDCYTCQYCGVITKTNGIVEHIIPAYEMGVAKPYNLVYACQKCNTLKRRQVWIPMNFDIITKDNPEWKEKVLLRAVKDFRITFKLGAMHSR